MQLPIYIIKNKVKKLLRIEFAFLTFEGILNLSFKIQNMLILNPSCYTFRIKFIPYSLFKLLRAIIRMSLFATSLNGNNLYSGQLMPIDIIHLFMYAKKTNYFVHLFYMSIFDDNCLWINMMAIYT